MALHHKVLKVGLEVLTYAGTFFSILVIGIPMLLLGIFVEVAADCFQLGRDLYNKLKEY